MSRVDKATSERNTKTLRELVKRPENKVCADCKRNDPRWASWNLGVFVCIRCSGIHRSMGTHISKVKSVDLDMWTPEQMASVQKWGNRRANLYWEAHLKAGHVPPDHKIESFIRSKYESRRWAMEGPPPSDPSVLESGQAEPEPAPAAAAAPLTPPTRAPAAHPSRAAQPAQPTSPMHLQRNLLSSTHVQQQRASAAPAPPAPTEDSLWTLDFNAPPAAAAAKPQPQPDVKNNIMSLFAQAPVAAAPAAPSGFGAFSSGGAPQPHQQQQQQSFMNQGQGGSGLWGAPSSAWQPPAPAPAPAPNVWGQSAPAPVHNANGSGAFGADIWGAPQGGGGGGGGGLFETPFASQPAAAKKDDAFGDLWSSFK